MLLKLVFAAHFPLLYPGDIIAIYYRDREVIGGIRSAYPLKLYSPVNLAR